RGSPAPRLALQRPGRTCRGDSRHDRGADAVARLAMRAEDEIEVRSDGGGGQHDGRQAIPFRRDAPPRGDAAERVADWRRHRATGPLTGVRSWRTRLSQETAVVSTPAGPNATLPILNRSAPDA